VAVIGFYIVYFTSDILVSKQPHEILGTESFDNNTWEYYIWKRS